MASWPLSSTYQQLSLGSESTNIYPILVLRTEDNDGPRVSKAFKIGTHSRIDTFGEDVAGMFGELEDILGDFVPEQGCIDWLVEFAYDTIDNNIGVKDGELLFEFKRNGDVGFLDILVALDQNLMGFPVFTVLLLSRCDRHCYLGRIPEVLQDSIEIVSEDGVLRLSISLAHEVIEQFLD